MSQNSTRVVPPSGLGSLRPALCLLLFLAPLWPGCASREAPESDAADRASTRAGWKLVLSLDGDAHESSLQSMDIFLQEDEESAEPFAITGDGVRLAGTIPVAHAVGYEEDFDRLIGRRVAILPGGFDGDGDFESSIDLGDGGCAVQGGWIEFREVTGSQAGAEGDRTLHGDIELRTDRGVIRGEIGVHAITWG